MDFIPSSRVARGQDGQSPSLDVGYPSGVEEILRSVDLGLCEVKAAVRWLSIVLKEEIFRKAMIFYGLLWIQNR